MAEPDSTSDTSPRQAKGLLCPICQVTLLIADRQGIEVDYCPQCRGVWLDRGELDKIIERNAAYESSISQPRVAAPAPMSDYARSDYREHADDHHEGSRHGGRHDGRGGGSFSEHGGQRGGFLGGLFGH